MARILVALLCGLLAAAAASAEADPCFCLRHSSGQMLQGCRAEQFPGQFYATAFCSGQEKGMLMTGSWTKVEEGEDECRCERKPRVPDYPPRGEDDEVPPAATK